MNIQQTEIPRDTAVQASEPEKAAGAARQQDEKVQETSDGQEGNGAGQAGNPFSREEAEQAFPKGGGILRGQGA